MLRADSAMSGGYGAKPDFARGVGWQRKQSSTSQTFDKEPSSRPVTSSGRHKLVIRDSRKQSVSTLPSKSHRKSESRSSSINSHGMRGDRPGPRRIRSCPVETRATSNIEDAIALHERSCQLMKAYYGTGISLEPTQPPMQRVTTETDPLLAGIHPELYNSNVVEQPADLEQGHTFSDGEAIQQPVFHWISESTRRKQYAQIDKQNRGLRKLVRKLMPGCFSNKAGDAGFYGERDASDVHSVRRYRIALAGDEKVGDRN